MCYIFILHNITFDLIFVYVLLSFIGGVCNTMPYTFEKVPFKKLQVGLTTFFVFNCHLID